tara:strand:- start:2932 stop:4125 length:1194 start_codon:yes stop_codon:yes gene_type:complete
MKCKGFTQIENICCTYNIYDNADNVCVELEFWEKNCNITNIKKTSSSKELFSDSGIIINEIIKTSQKTIIIETLKLVEECDKINIDISYNEKSIYNNIADANASLLNAFCAIIDQQLIQNPQEMSESAKIHLQTVIYKIISQISKSDRLGPSFNNILNKLLGAGHVLFDEKLDNIIADTMKIQTYVTHIQNYLEEVHDGKSWDEGFSNDLEKTFVRSVANREPHDNIRNSYPSCDSTKSHDYTDNSENYNDINSTSDFKAENDYNQDKDKLCKTNTENNTEYSYHSGDTQQYCPVIKPCSSVRSRCSSYATYRFNPKNNRFEISAMPSNNEQCQTIEMLPKMSYAYCEKKVIGIYKLINQSTPNQSDVIHYSNLMRKQQITSHDLVCILQSQKVNSH